MMKVTQLLHDEGQSLWLDNITRDLLDSGTLKQYIDDLPIAGLTSNPTIFDHAIKNSTAYDAADKSGQGKSSEALFFELALEDLTPGVDVGYPKDLFDLFRQAGTLTQIDRLAPEAARGASR
jgi:transaldolase